MTGASKVRERVCVDWSAVLSQVLRPIYRPASLRGLGGVLMGIDATTALGRAEQTILTDRLFYGKGAGCLDKAIVSMASEVFSTAIPARRTI